MRLRLALRRERSSSTVLELTFPRLSHPLLWRHRMGLEGELLEFAATST